MNKRKRIFGILMSFVMVFSIFAGNLSYAAGDEKSISFETFLDGESVQANSSLGIKIKDPDNKISSLTGNTKLKVGGKYTIIAQGAITLEEIDVVSGAELGADKKSFTVKDNVKLKIFLKTSIKNKITIDTVVGDKEHFPEQLDLTIGDKKFTGTNKTIYLERGKNYAFTYNEEAYTLKTIDGAIAKENTLQVKTRTENFKLVFEINTGKVNFEVKLSAPSEVASKIKVKLDNEDYALGTNKKLLRGSHKLSFSGMPDGYALVARNKDGYYGAIDNEHEFTLDGDTVLWLGVKHKDLQVLIDAPKTSSTKEGVEEFNLYTTPSTSVKVLIINQTNNSVIYSTDVKTDLNGKATVKNTTGRILDGDIVKATAESNKLIAENSVKVNSEKIKLEVKAEEISIGHKKITGTSTGASVKAYVYNISTKKFNELEEAKVSNGKFEIEYKTGFVTDDRVYIKAMNSKDEGSYTILKTVSSVERLSGPNRLVTAVKIARESYPKTDAVIIANGYISADALAAGPLANELNAPILLVDDDFVIQDIVSYIKESGAKKIYIAGGPNSVSDKVVRNVKPSATTETERIYGSDRYETSLKIAEKLVKNHDYKKSVIFANGLDDKDADALAASTYATQSKQAIILTRENATTDKVKTGLKSLGITSVEIVGGPKTVSDKAVTDAGLTVGNRTYGDNRYETSVEIAKKLENVNSIIIANGYKSADALASAPLAKTKNAAILLSTENSITDSQTEFIKSKKPIGTIYIAGGPKSVFTPLEKTLEDLIK